MQKKLVLLVALAACRIPDEHYTHVGDLGDAGPGGDGAPGVDAAPNPNAQTHGYLFDFQTGIYRVNKDPTTGALALADPNPTVTGGAPSGVANKEGTHLYAVLGASSQIIDFSIAPSGVLTQQAIVPTGNCAPTAARLHPGGRFLAVGCSNSLIAIMPIAPSGALGTAVLTPAGSIPITPAFTPNGSCLYFTDLNGPATSRVLAFQFNPATGAVTASGAATGPITPRGLAVHPSGGFAYAGGSNAIHAYGIDATCGLAPLGALPVGGNTQGITIDPPGGRLFVTGTEVYAFTIAGSGMLTAIPGSPFLASGTTMDGATMDPAVPNLLYITGRGYSGSFVAQISANGTISQGPSLTVGGGGDTWLQLVK